MKERPKTIGTTRLFWSLVLGLGLALGLLWAVMPHSAVEAQTINPGLTGKQSTGQQPQQCVEAAQAVNPGFTLDLAYEAVWGMLNPGDWITVTRTAGGAAYGAAEADGVGFFWTPLWQSDGQPADIVGDPEDIEIYVNGALAATIYPLEITGQVDVLNDQVTGTVAGLATGDSVTVTLGDFGRMVADVPRVVTTVDGSGDFTADFGGIADIGPHEMAQVQYRDANGNTIQGYVYPSEVFRVDYWNSVHGYATPRTPVTVTIYMTYPTDVVWDGQTTTQWPHGTYAVFGYDFEYGEVVEVDLGGGTVISVAVDYMEMRPDAATNQITGQTPAGAEVRGYVWDDVEGLYDYDTDTADGSGNYTLTLGIDLQTRHWAYVAYADAEGDEVGYAAPPPHIRAYPMWDSIYAVADRPHQPATYTLDTGSGIFTEYVECGANNRCDWMNFDSVEPGHVITVELPNRTMVMTVPTVTLQVDTANDRASGDANLPGRLDVGAEQWQGWQYPIHGSATTSATVSSPYTVTFPDFDIRDGISFWAIHYDTNGQRALVYHRRQNQGIPQAYFEVNPTHNGVGGVPPSADEPVTATLYSAGGTPLVSTSDDHDGNPWRFWLGDFQGYEFEPGHWITVTSESGWEAGLQIPDMTVKANETTEMIWGKGPKSLLFVEHSGRNGWDGRFVPVDDYALDRAFFGDDIQWGDWIATSYQAPNGNRVQAPFQWPHVIAHYQMDGRNDVWGQNSIAGNTIYITITDELGGFVDAGTTFPGSGDQGPTSYRLDLADGAIVPSNTVHVDFGSGFTYSTTVVSITGQANADTDIVTVTVPISSWVHVNASDPYDNWWESSWSYEDTQVGASGYVTFDLSVDGFDIIPGANFNVHVEDTQYTFWLPAPELSIDKWNAPGYARPDGVVVYGINYWNNGNGVATDTLIVDTLPTSTTYAGDTSGVTPIIGAGGVITWNMGDVEAGDDGGFVVTLDIFDLSDGDTIDQNCVVITTTTPGDYDLGNNGPSCAGSVDVLDDNVEVGVDKWPNPGDPTPGQEFEYGIRPCSYRGAAAGPLWLTDTLPLSTTFVSWSSDFGDTTYWTEVVTTGGQLVLYAPGLPGDMCEDLHLRLLLDADASISTTLENTIVITAAGDVDLNNNGPHVNTDAHASGPRYDMNTEKWYNNGVLVPGGWIRYGANYWNAGNIVAQAWITDELPPGTSYQPGSGQDHDGEPFEPVKVTADYVVWELGVVPVNDGFGFDFTLDISDTVVPPAVLTNCVTVGITGTEDTPSDNTACVTKTVYASGPNLYVTKESDYGPGNDMINYQINFGNLGDQTVYDAVITDTFPISTTYDWHNVNWEGSQYTDTASAAELVIVFERMEPGWSGRIDLGARLDDPNARFRWYTNTVEITTPPNDTNTDDNTDFDVAFSGGEVEEVDLDVYGNNFWGCAYSPPVTITTAYTEVVLGWECWDEWFEDPFQPGDVVTVKAGVATHPVVISIPDPFSATADSVTDMVWGQINGLDHEWVDVDPNGLPTQNVQTDGSGNYSATFTDIPRGGQGEVRYNTEIDYANVTFHRRFRTPDLIITVDYEHDWVHGNYEPGHTVWITLTESDSSTVKATAVLTTGPIPWWGGQSGFETQWYDWSPSQPDIQPGDWVYGLVNSESYTTTVHVGTINGEVDADNDIVSGTIEAPWLAPDLVTVNCEIHEENGQGIEVHNVDPDGGSFFCDFTGLYDIEPGHNIAVNYVEPDSDRVQAHPPNPAPYLQINKWADGNPGEGGNFVFQVQYQNQGGDDAEDVVITDTMMGGMTYITDTSGFPHTGSGSGPIVWDLGTLKPSDGWIEFYVFVHVTAAQSDTITNTIQIATSDPYDQGDPGEKESWWNGHVEANDTHLNVGKGAWTGDPAPGYDFVYGVNVCNNGSTGSSQVTLTDTLHPSMTLQSWWGQHAGWVELFSGTRHLIVARPSIPGWWCGEVYLRVHLDGSAWPGMYITNTAVISASNDMEDNDNEAFWDGWVNDPHTNLHINKNWNWGQLVPDGELRYGINYGNNGNVPVTTTIRITDSLPVSTTFVAAWRYDEYGQYPVTPTQVTADYVVWEINGLDNGYWGDFEIALDVDSDAVPGTVLTNTAEISPQPSEDSYDDNVATVVETLYDHGINLRVRKEGGWNDWGGNTRQAWYNLTVENVGDASVIPVVITDTYDSKMYLDGGVGADYWRWWDWRDDPVNHTFTVTLEVLYPGEMVNINFSTITDTEPLPFGLIFTNTAEVMLDPSDTNPDDNVGEAILTTGPDLYVEKTLVAGDLLPGELITFSLAFGNDHEGHEWWWNMQGNARLTDVLPDGLEYVGSTRSPDFQVGSTLFWFLWPINAGEWNEIYLTARITDTAEGDDIFTNWVEITSDDPGSDVEPYYGNNEDTYDVIIALPKFEIGKVYESSRVAGMPVTYTLTVTNVGTEVGTGVIVSDTVPSYLSNVSSGGTLNFGWIWWQLGPIAPNGGTATAWFSATLPCTASLSIANNNYGVYGSDQGVSGPAGDPVTFTVPEPTITAAFTHTLGTAVVSDTVYFTGTASTDGTGLSYEWDFDDGTVTVGSELTITHVYIQDGVYTVAFTATDTCGYSGVATATVTVNAPNLVANFDYSPKPANILVNSTVAFTDTSTTDVPPIVAWLWDFGNDSTPATTQDASHTYTAAGTYTVTLVVTDALGYSDDEVKTNIITVSLACTPVTSVTFDYVPAEPVIQSPVVFTATATPPDATATIAYAWDFGDGGAGSGRVVNHTYALSDTYTVIVTATNCAGAGVATHTEDVAVILTEGAQTTVDPATGGTLIYTDTQGNPTIVQVPGNAISEPITLLYTPVSSPTQPISPNLRFANHTFDLDAYLGSSLLSGFIFSRPVTITIHYSDDDVKGMDESSLRLYYWTGSVWDDAVNTCSPPSTYTRDLAQNVLGAPICHLSRFGVMGTSLESIYLPLVMRNF